MSFLQIEVLANVSFLWMWINSDDPLYRELSLLASGGDEPFMPQT